MHHDGAIYPVTITTMKILIRDTGHFDDAVPCAYLIKR